MSAVSWQDGADPPLDYRYLSDATKRAGFSCRNADIDRWFSRDALKAHRTGSIVVVCASQPDAPDRPIGFYALATVAEEFARLPNVGPRHRLREGTHFSALQLVWLAVDHGFQGRGFGSRLMGQVIRTFAEVAPRIGLPALIVVPDEANYGVLKHFYESLDFQEYVGGGTMFLPLQVAIAAGDAIDAPVDEPGIQD